MSVEITVPSLGESIVEATVGRWLKAEGDTVDAGDALVELETDKVNMEVASPAAGLLRSVVSPEGMTVSIGDLLGVVEDSGVPTDGPQVPTVAATTTSTPVRTLAEESTEVTISGSNGEASRATPLARRVADQLGVDIHSIHGTGPGGRVTREDVTLFTQNSPTSGTSQSTPSASSVTREPAMALTEESSGRREERVRMSRRRQTIARRLVEAQHTAAMLTTFNEIDMSAIMDMRKRRRDAFKDRHGVNLGFMSFFVKATVGALKAFPRLNAEIQGDEMVLKHYYDIGIAVGMDEGLVVPVVRDAGTLSFAEIERQIGDLAARARNKQLTLADLQGGTFSITNGGIYGNLLSTPILNYPQVGILGMHKIQDRPIAIDGEVVIRPMMYVAVSYDHRIVDGNEAVRFLVRIKELVEDPETLLLEG